MLQINFQVKHIRLELEDFIMKFNQKFQSNSSTYFLLEVDEHILQQLDDNHDLQIQQGQSVKDMKNYAYLLTSNKVFEIYKKELTNQILVCNDYKRFQEIQCIQDKILQLKEVQPNFKQIMLHLENIQLEDFKKNQLPTFDQICQQFIISKSQLKEFLNSKKIYTQDEIIFFLNENELFSIFINLLAKLKVIVRTFEHIDTTTDSFKQMHSQFSSENGSKLTDFLFDYFFKKNKDDSLYLNFDTVLSTLVFDILNKSDEFFYIEFMTVVEEALKLCYPIQQYLDEIKPKYQTQEFKIQVQDLIKQRGIIKDYNEYTSSNVSLWSEENIKMLVNNYKNIDNVNRRLEVLSKYKNLYSKDELEIYFRDQFQSKNQYESFIKKGFKKIFEEIHIKKLEKFKEFNPKLSLNLLKGMTNNTKSIQLYKTKNIWL